MITDQEMVQQKFFKAIQKRRGHDAMLAGVMKVLQIKKGAVYNRINGTTALTSSEMIALANYFEISIDSIFQGDKYISFDHPFMEKKSSLAFLDRFSFYLKPLSHPQESSLIYLANELPVFYYFSHKYIFNFLLSVWNHMQWADTRLVIEENLLIEQQLETLRDEITKTYEGCPVTEIWNSNMFANLYQQITFSVTIRAFKNQDYIHKLLADIQALIDHLRNLVLTVEGATGSVHNNRKIYLNDFGNYLNLVLYQSPKMETTFIGYDMPHFLVSYNKEIFQYSSNWIDKIKNRSVFISGQGYQYRELFFIKMEDDFKHFEDRLKKLMQIYYT